VLAQRLVRKVCTHCSTPRPVDGRRLPADFPPPEGRRLVEGQGCRECRQTGYRGRIGVYELLTLSEPLRDLVMRRAGSGRLAEVAGSEGSLRPLRDDAFAKAAAGLTTISEALRVVPA